MEKDTLLYDFMASKLLDYEAPKHYARDRGKNWASRPYQYAASMFVGLTSLSLKKISAELIPLYKIKRKVLQKWCHKQDFRELSKCHVVEFALYVIRHIEEKFSHNGKPDANDFDNASADEPPSIDADEIYAHMSILNRRVLNLIAQLNLNRIEAILCNNENGNIEEDAFKNELQLFIHIDKIIHMALESQLINNHKMVAKN